MVTFEVLNCNKGDAEIKIRETSTRGRKKLAKFVMQTLTEGNAIFLDDNGQDRRIIGYNEKTNRWKFSKAESVSDKPVKDDKVTVVAPVSGG